MTTLNLEAKRHTSRILQDWAKSRPGAAERIGVNNAILVTSTDLAGMSEIFRPISSPSGFVVNDKTAMQVSTVYACLSKLGGAISQLPIEQYRLMQDGQRTPVPRSSLWWILNETPSPAWTHASWMEWIVRCVALRGDQHTEIVRSKSGSTYGDITGLKIHHPDYVNARRLSGRLVYDVQDMETGRSYTVDQDDMLHFAGFGFDGISSLSMIQHGARSGIGNSLAAADYSGRSIGEGAMPQIAISYPNKFGKEQAQQLRESFVNTYGTGTGARKLPLVLGEGGAVHELSISPVDMELMASRQFEREDIYQAIGVPGVLIGDNAKTSSWGTGVEQITLGFVKYTVKPHLQRWEEELNRKLFRNAGPFVKFDLDALLSGDSKAQAEAFRAALGGPGTGDGYQTPNEIRRIKNLPPVAGGDEIFRAARPMDEPAKADNENP